MTILSIFYSIYDSFLIFLAKLRRFVFYSTKVAVFLLLLLLLILTSTLTSCDISQDYFSQSSQFLQSSQSFQSFNTSSQSSNTSSQSSDISDISSSVSNISSQSFSSSSDISQIILPPINEDEVFNKTENYFNTTISDRDVGPLSLVLNPQLYFDTLWLEGNIPAIIPDLEQLRDSIRNPYNEQYVMFIEMPSIPNAKCYVHPGEYSSYKSLANYLESQVGQDNLHWDLKCYIDNIYIRGRVSVNVINNIDCYARYCQYAIDQVEALQNDSNRNSNELVTKTVLFDGVTSGSRFVYINQSVNSSDIEYSSNIFRYCLDGYGLNIQVTLQNKSTDINVTSDYVDSLISTIENTLYEMYGLSDYIILLRPDIYA